jgi:hypothetical protein
MPKHAASTPTPADVSSPSIYPADLTVALQAELSMLSAIDADYAEKRQRLETWASPQESRNGSPERLRSATSGIGSRMCFVWANFMSGS